MDLVATRQAQGRGGTIQVNRTADVQISGQDKLGGGGGGERFDQGRHGGRSFRHHLLAERKIAAAGEIHRSGITKTDCRQAITSVGEVDGKIHAQPFAG